MVSTRQRPGTGATAAAANDNLLVSRAVHRYQETDSERERETGNDPCHTVRYSTGMDPTKRTTTRLQTLVDRSVFFFLFSLFTKHTLGRAIEGPSRYLCPGGMLSVVWVVVIEFLGRFHHFISQARWLLLELCFRICKGQR